MDIGTVRGLLTAILLVLFLGIVFWAYSRKRRSDFDEAAQLPLDDEHDGKRERSRDKENES